MTENVTPERIEGWSRRAAELDPANMRGHIAGLADQIEAALDRAVPFVASLPRGETPAAVAVFGMGGSAMGADLVAAYTDDRRRLPCVTVRGYEIPSWIDERALGVASSYSGNTEEAISCYEEAKRRGMRVVAITTGGRLRELAQENGDPVLDLPKGFPPRAAIGHSFAAVALVAAHYDPSLDPRVEQKSIAALPGVLRPLADRWLAWSAGNPALEIAAAIAERLPVVYAGHPISIAAARRWKTQLNENAKIPTYWSEFPEHNHNEIVGFEGGNPALDHLALVYLETPWDHPRVTKRMDFVHGECAGKVGWQRRVREEAAAETALESLFRLFYLGDCASFFVSIVTGKDPTPVRSIDRLKSVLAD
jgi:glucose/mannose-6-phosphate isomerase